MYNKNEGNHSANTSLPNKIQHYVKQSLLNGLLIIISLVFVLVLSEGAFYVLNKMYPVERLVVGSVNSEPNQERKDFFQYHSVYGYAGLPNVQKEYRGKIITHNAKGLRGKELPYEKPQGVKRAVFLGDSQTWGWGVGDEETIPAYFEEIMNQRSPVKFETVNLGATGYGPGQSYLRLISEGLRYEPDVVVFTYFADNDLGEANTYDAWGVEKPLFFEQANGELCVSNVPPRRASGWPTDNIGFIVREQLNLDNLEVGIGSWKLDLAETNIATYFMNRNLNKSVVGLWGADDSDPLAAIDKWVGCRKQGPAKQLTNWQQQKELMMKLIYKIRDTAEAVGAQFIVITKPLENDYNNNNVSQDYAYVLKELSKNNIRFVELFTTGKRLDLSTEQFFLGYGHLTAEVNRLAASGAADLSAELQQISSR
ncbi:GDSL-like lipase/acylhydrolase family protein [Alteromonadaceae bacterium 2753L.S.0a.02]|nr:GDSL-like lipase/acylhydrolase family protein [Alteromonadaceae bacterium 2753L.S.0a.02]